LRKALEYIPRSDLAWRRALQFAPDGSLEESWFRTYEASTYGGKNSIDMQAIDRPADSYDFISSSMVLEFVPDDRKAFSELLRVGSDALIMHLTFTSGLKDAKTQHYEQAKGWGTWHDYGWDYDEWFGTAEREISTLVVNMPDPVTGDATYPFCFLFRRESDLDTWAAALAEAPQATIKVNKPNS
jgi:hypothetical protein